MKFINHAKILPEIKHTRKTTNYSLVVYEVGWKSKHVTYFDFVNFYCVFFILQSHLPTWYSRGVFFCLDISETKWT